MNKPEVVEGYGIVRRVCLANSRVEIPGPLLAGDAVIFYLLQGAVPTEKKTFFRRVKHGEIAGGFSPDDVVRGVETVASVDSLTGYLFVACAHLNIEQILNSESRIGGFPTEDSSYIAVWGRNGLEALQTILSIQSLGMRQN